MDEELDAHASLSVSMRECLPQQEGYSHFFGLLEVPKIRGRAQGGLEIASRHSHEHTLSPSPYDADSGSPPMQRRR